MSTHRTRRWLATATLASLPLWSLTGAAQSVPEAAAPAAPESVATPAAAPVTTAPATATGLMPVAVSVINPEDLGDYGKTVVVPTVYVKLLTEGSVFVAQQGGLFGGNNSVKAKAAHKVVGLDKGLARAIAKQAQDDFVSRLRAAGYAVMTYDDIKDRDYVVAAERDAGDARFGLPMEKSADGRDSFVVAAPSDAQQFKIGFTGPFSSFVQYGKPKFTDATVIIPQYTIVAPQFWGEKGGGFNTISAAVHTAPGMNLQSASAHWMGKPKVRMGTGISGVAAKAALVNTSAKAGQLVQAEDTTPVAANALSKALGMLSGTGSIKQNSADYTFTIDPTLYVQGAMLGIGSFNAEFAKVASTAP